MLKAKEVTWVNEEALPAEIGDVLEHLQASLAKALSASLSLSLL
jgi:hypothetical protein